MFRSTASSLRRTLSPQQTLEYTNLCLENARNTEDLELSLQLCRDAETTLARLKSASRSQEKDGPIRVGVATAYSNLGKLQDSLGESDKAQTSFRKVEQWGGVIQESPQVKVSTRINIHTQPGTLEPALASPTDEPVLLLSGLPLAEPSDDIPPFPSHIFVDDMHPPTVVFDLPEVDERLGSTPQLAYCLGLLRASHSPEDIHGPAAQNWLQTIKEDINEQERLETLATDVIRTFKRDELKDAKAIAEVVHLAPVLKKEDYRYLLKEFYSGVDQSDLLNVHQLEGLAQLIRGADPCYLDADDLVRVLQLLSARLSNVHRQSQSYIYQLTTVVSHVLDAMADTKVKGLDRETLHEPLASYLDGLKGSSDPYLVYQAAYAFQALQYVPDNETPWQATLRRTGKVVQGVSGLVSAVRGFDLNGFFEGLGNIQQGFAGVTEMFKVAKDGYENVSSLVGGGQGFLSGLKEGLSFERKRAWYPALRGADVLIREGQLAKFRILVCDGPCGRDPAFQWGVCQRLGEIAADTTWGFDTRRNAVDFLGEIYRNDAVWGQQASVKQWCLNILMQSASLPGNIALHAESVLQELETTGDLKKRAFYQACREKSPGSHPLRINTLALETSALLDLVQNKPDVENSLRQLKRKRLEERGNVVYIPPQAKASLQAPDDARFPLMGRVKEFLDSEQKVFLLLGDSGAGKSTFNKALESDLWQACQKRTGVIPLHINLPSIDKPDQDMIGKHLRKADFSDPQIRELKMHRKFVLICDGYDESQQTRNLYTSNRLNEQDEWQAKMVISCRTEYIGADYRDRFQPGDRNQRSDLAQFQEAVMTPFTVDQVQDYIIQYVSIHRPLWRAEDYLQALDLIPSLKELVKNPFLMTLSLEVLPRMIDPGQHLTVTHVTRVTLYDQFVEQWLERGKRRLGEKDMSPGAKTAFESLSDEGFTLNGIDYLKKLSVAIYKEQGGQPVVEYSRIKDEGSWKTAFFSRDDEKQLLREACPLTRSGNQHRFIHRSLLEYGLALATFDPQDWKKKQVPEAVTNRRGSVGSAWSFELDVMPEEVDTTATEMLRQEMYLKSPLVWRNFVNEPSLLHFLEERAQQEPIFEQQLRDYIELSKTDKVWRTAAANAITILVRAGMQFNHANLQGVRIPGADLSYGVFESAQLQGADLRKVNMHGAWLQKANLSGTQMTGAQFGELPSLQHDKRVTSFAYSPDGTLLAVGLYSGDIVVYTTSDWEQVWTLRGHTETVVSIVFSSKGDQIASGSRDDTARLWDVVTGTCRHALIGHDDDVESIAFSPQGDLVASISHDITVRLWDVSTGFCLRILIGHTRLGVRVAFSPLGNQIASSSLDMTARLWDVETGVCLSTLTEHQGRVKYIIYSPQGDLLASSDDTTVRLWDVQTGACRHKMKGHEGQIDGLLFSPKGDLVATGSEDTTVRIWDVESGTCRYTLKGHRSQVKEIAFSPQGDLLVSASVDKTLRLWDVETGACRETFTGHAYQAVGVLYSPNGRQLASRSLDEAVRLWDISVGTTRVMSSNHNDSVLVVKYSPTGDQIASSSDDGTLRLWDVKTGMYRPGLSGDASSISTIAYSPRGDRIACGSYDRRVRFYDTKTGTCLHAMKVHDGDVTEVAYSPQGDLLASSSWDKTVIVWDAQAGEPRHTLTGHTETVNSVMFSPDGRQVVSCSGDLTIRIWDVQSGICCRTLLGHEDWIRRAVYSPQGNQLASCGEDCTVRLWDVQAGECLHILTGHEAEVNFVTYSPNGQHVASASQDETVRLWDVESGECRHILSDHSGDVKMVAFSLQGNLLASASEDMSVRIWDVISGDCRAAILDFDDTVHYVDWNTTVGVDCVAIAGEDGSVRLWEVRIEEQQEEDGSCPLTLRWRSTIGALVAKETILEDVQGLSSLNRQLLLQRGAHQKQEK
ncbi:hypothetical protein BGX34_011467 [Mortierella sp. NVP85]|nr:hypothetical protein BGX34_011467 [Mortierella sp. NVP85]